MSDIIESIAFISWPVTDMARAVEFYKTLFDIDPLIEQGEWTEFKIQGQRLALHMERVENEKKYASRNAVLFFKAPSIEDSIKKLTDKGINFNEKVQAHPYGKMVRFKDPDGNPLGLYEPPSKADSPNATLK